MKEVREKAIQDSCLVLFIAYKRKPFILNLIEIHTSTTNSLAIYSKLHRMATDVTTAPVSWTDGTILTEV